MRSRGLVLDTERSLDTQPSVLATLDRTRFADNGTNTAITYVQLPSGLWVHSFNGSTGKIDFGGSASLRPTAQISVVAWATIGAGTGAAQYPRLIGNLTNDGGWKGWGIYQNENSRNLSAEISTADNGLQQVGIGAPALDTWRMFGFTYNGAILTRFFNGASVGTNAMTGAITYAIASNSVKMGASGVSADMFKGLAALVRVWGYALTAGQFAQLFESERWLFGL